MADLFPLRTWLSPWQMLVVVSDPDDVHKVLSDPKTADKAYSYKFLKNDHGLLTSERESSIISVSITPTYPPYNLFQMTCGKPTVRC